MRNYVVASGIALNGLVGCTGEGLTQEQRDAVNKAKGIRMYQKAREKADEWLLEENKVEGDQQFLYRDSQLLVYVDLDDDGKVEYYCKGPVNDNPMFSRYKARFVWGHLTLPDPECFVESTYQEQAPEGQLLIGLFVGTDGLYVKLSPIMSLELEQQVNNEWNVLKGVGIR